MCSATDLQRSNFRTSRRRPTHITEVVKSLGVCSPALEENRRRRAAREDACPWSGHGGTVATLAPRYVGRQLGQMAVSTHGDDELGTVRRALKFAATSSAGMWMQQFSGGGLDRFALALPGFLQGATTRQQWSRTARFGQGRARRNVEDRWNKSVA